MTKLKRYLMWFCMLSKRLFFKWSFVAVLCLIPVMVPLFGIIMDKEESGMVSVVLCNESGDKDAAAVVDRLMEEDSVLLFSYAETREEAIEAVENQQADVAWIFPENYIKLLEENVAGSGEPVIEILKREWSTPVRIAQEKLYSAIYPDISYATYKTYSYQSLVTPEKVPESELREIYDGLLRGKDIIATEHLDGKEQNTELSYLTAPVRGILSLMVVLCSIIAAMYFLDDRRHGRFDWLPERHRIAPAFASCLSASLISGVFVYFAILLSGLAEGAFIEIASMFMFILECTCFATVLCMLFRSPGKLGAALPGMIIIMLVLCPIFFNFKVLYYVRLMLPPYYYLNSLYGTSYLLSGINYCIIMTAVAFLINFLRTTKRNLM